MPRLLGVEIPAEKRIEASLTYIYGVGLTTARRILEQTNIDPNLRAKDLTPQQINEIIHAITNNKIQIEGDLRREVQGNLKRLQAINSYRGVRHRRGLPVRGQRTSTNARTRKGPRKTVGVIRNKDAKAGKVKQLISMPDSKKPTKPKAEKPKAKKTKAEGSPKAAAASAAPVGEAVAPIAVAPEPAKSKPEAAARPAKKTEKPKEEAKPAEAPRENLSLDPDDVEKPKIVKAKGSKNIHSGIAHVLSTFNNTIVTITDLNGNVIGWSSAGKVGFKGSRKSTAYAAQMVAQDASRQAMGHGLKEVEVLVRGPGAGRESAVRALQAIGLDLTLIRDVTPVPHNGCRPPKQRRV